MYKSATSARLAINILTKGRFNNVKCFKKYKSSKTTDDPTKSKQLNGANKSDDLSKNSEVATKLSDTQTTKPISGSKNMNPILDIINIQPPIDSMSSPSLPTEDPSLSDKNYVQFKNIVDILPLKSDIENSQNKMDDKNTKDGVTYVPVTGQERLKFVTTCLPKEVLRPEIKPEVKEVVPIPIITKSPPESVKPQAVPFVEPRKTKPMEDVAKSLPVVTPPPPPPPSSLPPSLPPSPPSSPQPSSPPPPPPTPPPPPPPPSSSSRFSLFGFFFRMITLGVKLAIVGGAICWSQSEGVWGDGEDSEKFVRRWAGSMGHQSCVCMPDQEREPIYPTVAEIREKLATSYNGAVSYWIHEISKFCKSDTCSCGCGRVTRCGDHHDSDDDEEDLG